MTPMLETSFGWLVDYYLERISIKLAELFGAFSKFLILLFIIMMFCSFVLWLIMPFIEIRKKILLQKIYHHLAETEKQLTDLNKKLDKKEKRNNNHFPDDIFE